MRRLIPPLAVAIAALAGWQIVSSASRVHAVSSPLDTIEKLFQMLATAHFWLDTAETGTAFFWAFALSILCGLVLGVLLSLSRPACEVVEPILVTFYAMPKVTLYPLVLLAFGLGMSAKVAFGVMHGLVPIALMTRNAITQMRPIYLRTATMLKLSQLQTIRWVLLPATLPDLLAGARIGFSLSLLGVLIGEMFAAKRGLGYAAMNAMGLGDVTTIMAIGIFLAAVAIAANAGLLTIENAVRRKSSVR